LPNFTFWRRIKIVFHAIPIVSGAALKSSLTTVIIAAICSKGTPDCFATADTFDNATEISDLLLRPANLYDHKLCGV
jgi:hypothetical protein